MPAFHDKTAPPPVVAYAGPVYVSGVGVSQAFSGLRLG